MLMLLMSATLVASTISGIIGMGGGILLLAVMASLLAPIAVVPVHGVVQLVSNGTRAFRLFGNVNWRFFAHYAPMLVAGAFVGIRLYTGAGAPWFKPFIGAFVLAFLLWERVKPERLQVPLWVLVPAGFVGGVLTVVVGATGPYLAAFFLRDDMNREEVVATKATTQMVGHLVKIPAFFSIGFDYAAHAGLIAPLVVCAIAGTFIGTSVLKRLPERGFQVGFRLVLAALAIRLIWTGVA